MPSPLDEALKKISLNPTPALKSSSTGIISPSSQARISKALSGITRGSERSGDIGFGGIFGDVIDVIDTPRSILASTAQEVVDVFQGEGFSPTDWWEQVEDNHLFGEVLRDSGVDLPGPLDFALGLAL